MITNAGRGPAAAALTLVSPLAASPVLVLRGEAAEEYHAVEGGRQTLSNRAAYVTEIVRKGAEG